MLIIDDQKFFDEVVAFAERVGKYKGDGASSLKSALDFLERYGGDEGTRVWLYRGDARYSFGFVIEKRDAAGQWRHLFNGRLLYHGGHDGSATPTLVAEMAVPTSGWLIHT